MLNILEAIINLKYIRAISILSVLGTDIFNTHVNVTKNLIKSPSDEFRKLARPILSLLSLGNDTSISLPFTWYLCMSSAFVYVLC
jgi:hypothetical protein